MTTNVRFQEQLLLDNEDTLIRESQRQFLRQLHVLNARIKEIMENQEMFIKFKESSSLQAKEIQAVTIHSEEM
ncbi:hypothetical protein RN001_004173 [Aquatica leii]|uniref:Uncharacterized protein n=1 Tax=Aquatica leii TaxID=1421715 RepID=A0AAN7PB14_9COLE|nr:hypothetical protein RN001_004173 [Aquatica leii]